MKKFCVVYTYRVTEDVTVEARNAEHAKKKFRELHPDEKITDVWEVTKEMADAL